MEQRTLKIGDRVIYCYEDGSVEFLSRSPGHIKNSLRRTFGSKNSHGYVEIRLIVNGKKKSFRVHRLIAKAFHPNPDDLLEVDHINRDINDNRPCNLRWASHEDNQTNRACVDNSIAKYGVRFCEDEKLYKKSYNICHVKLSAVQPNGKQTTYWFSSTSDPIYVALKSLSEKDRYYKYIALKNNHQEESGA